MVHILLFYVAYTKYAMVGQSREHAALALLGQIYNPKCRLLKAAREAEREREKKNKHAKRLAFHKNQPITAETDQIRGAASPSGEQNPLLLWWYYGSKEMEEKEEHQPKDCKKTQGWAFRILCFLA